MAQIQEEILFQINSKPSGEGIINTGNNMNVIAGNTLAYTHNFNLLNYRLFVSSIPFENAASIEDFASNIVSVGRSIAELNSGNESYFATDTPNTLPIDDNGELVFTLSSVIYGDDEYY